MTWTHPAAVLMMAAAFAPRSARALDVDACPTVTLPRPVARELRARYSDWKIVTTGLLDAEDAKLWRDWYPNQCPGMISARLQTTERIDFVVNLVKGQEQRAVAFLVERKGYQPVSECHPVVFIAACAS